MIFFEFLGRNFTVYASPTILIDFIRNFVPSIINMCVREQKMYLRKIDFVGIVGILYATPTR